MQITQRLLTSVLLAILLAGAVRSDYCDDEIRIISQCLSSVTLGPAYSCCNQLSAILGTRPQCLCRWNAQNQAQVQALATACSFQTPDLRFCIAASGTVPVNLGISTMLTLAVLGIRF